ncbi:Imm26 family immunity protein [Ralstonia solanacearum]|uniref:Imm26 family immunity protein n=1 Tax=Ralstonia solanacearum TaxID=305 RepID=UPI001FFAA119|nr:Imm26 family immunity protein [Ralstonia solanacearum]MDB0566533.1 immunity 26/phosphotriesterase HocA family protein [Ralstonia solanacearum]MDB0575784.1 immunity 26/phosphotriesterase HocA family protein [Ralstonia solanacearum]
MVSKKLGWEAKPRTMLRYVKPGDVFVFALGNGKYGVGRIISTVSLGHVAEFFDQVVVDPNVSAAEVCEWKRLKRPVILDSYSLFDRKTEGDWRIVARQENFEPSAISDVFFTYGDGDGRRKVDVFENETPVSSGEARNLPFYSPLGDEDVKREIFEV